EPNEDTSKDRSNDISIVIGATLGGAAVLMFFLYAVRMWYRNAQKVQTKQKKLEEYFKRLDFLKSNSTDAPVVFPLMMSKRALKPVGAHISTSSNNSASRRSTTARQRTK